ncbi:MAG: serine/threonine-protein kinase [Myxococcota bacterium]
MAVSWSTMRPEERAFLQDRIGFFGWLSGTVSLIAYVFLLVLAVLRGDLLETIRAPDMLWHLSAVAVMAMLWVLTRGGPKSERYLYAVEAVAIVCVAVAYTGMLAAIPPGEAPGLVGAFAMTYFLLAHAILVPSTALRTAVLGVAMAIPLLVGVYWKFSQAGVESVSNFGQDAVSGSGIPLAATRTVLTAMWWTCTTVFCTWTSRVIFGLRREIKSVRKLGQYTLERQLGQGGMGVVYRASHAMLRRPTAVKLLLEEHNSTGAMARFEREVQLTANLTHPNTVRVFDYGRTPDGTFYYVMEYLDGADLAAVVSRDGAQPPARVVSILRQAASALQEAHGIGLIHRDIKPSNILLTRQGGIPDIAKVLDFGLVKDLQADDEDGLTRGEEIRGTPQYLAPESISRPAAVDGRSDLYALGAVGYFLLTGEHVFSGATIVEICAHHLHSTPVPPSERANRPVPQELEALLLRCLNKDPADRPSSAAELVEALDALGEPTWTQKEAETWWAKHGAWLTRQSAGTTEASGKTIAVDFAARARNEGS